MLNKPSPQQRMPSQIKLTNTETIPTAVIRSCVPPKEPPK